MLAFLIHRCTSCRPLLIAWYGSAFFLAVAAQVGVSAADNVAWRTGEDFRRQLNSTLGFQWEGSPIRQGLHGLANNQRIAIWLDRRVDPGYEVDLLVTDATLEEALQRVGREIGGGVSFVGSVAYLGPKPVTEKLATLAAIRRDEVKALPTAARVRFETSTAWTWEALATPRELLSQLAQSAGTRVINIDQIPHDLWPAGDLPPMPLTDRMTLLLAGFDLTFEIARDGSAIRLTPMPREVSVERSYSPRGSLNDAATNITRAFPGLRIRKDGARLAITGTYEEHEAIDRLIRGETIRQAETTAGSKRFDLQFKNQPIGDIIKLIAEREALELRADTASQAKLQQRISLDVKQLTLEGLLEQVLMDTGVTHRIADGVLELRVP
ncbi:MAG: STN domain-containing protein [Planctomycetia bacterium]|nr:STN domain-containing protein [Planctomycetia bacterium]